MENAAEQRPSPRGERFFKSVLWSWLGVAVTLLGGFVVSPYIIRNIGHEGYGVWTLVFSLIEYYWLLDLGFRSATVKYSAHYRAIGEPERINEIINTGLMYYSVVAVVVLGTTGFLSGSAGRLFQISNSYQGVFPTLMVIVGVSWALGIVCNVFNACLEGFQRFDLSSRIWVITVGLRSIGSVLLLWLGYGLIELGIMVVASQVLSYVLSYFSFRRIFPSERFSPKLTKWPVMRKMVGYGVHTALATVADRLLNQSVPLLIGYFWPVAYAGYYNLSVRVLQYSSDALSRVAAVTAPNTAELWAKGDRDAVWRLGVLVNRYCLTLFLPVTIVLIAYGRELLEVWVGPAFAVYSAPLLPVLSVATALAIAGQVNSSAILYGLARHPGYARALLAEAILNIAALFVVIPRYGILGAAWVTSALMILNRGLYTPRLVCHDLKASYWVYMRSIYTRPIAAAVPVLGLVFGLKLQLPGQNWFELIAASALTILTYFSLAFFVCLDRQHRHLGLGWLVRHTKLGRES